MTVRNQNKTVVDLWISYAQEYLGETQCLKHNKVVINYNKWFADVNYRQQLSSQLNFEFSDVGIDEVKGYGGGSSFDEVSFQGKGSEMNVLGRWQEFVNDPLYCSLLNNQKLRDYSDKIFGYIPGTESLPIGKS